MILTQHHICVYFGHLYKSFDNSFPDLRAPKLEGGISDIIICSCSSQFLKFDSRSDKELVSSFKSSGRSSSWNEAAATGVLERVVYKINVILNDETSLRNMLKSWLLPRMYWKYQGVKNHFGGSLASISHHVMITSYSVKLSISPRVMIIPIFFGQKHCL